MAKIENISQLKLEMMRLKALKNTQENVLLGDIKAIQEALSPIKLIGLMASLFSKEQTKSLLMRGIDLGISFLANKYLKKYSATAKRLIILFTGNLTSKIIKEKSEWILLKLKQIFTSNKKNEPEEPDIYGDNY